MFGHWESQTRKLNRHYQSVRNLNLWNGVKSSIDLILRGLKSSSTLEFDGSVELNKEGKNMYTTRQSTVLDTPWYGKVDSDNEEIIGAFNKVPMKIIGNQGVATDNLYDNATKLNGDGTRFYGFQVTFFFLRSDLSNKMNGTYKLSMMKFQGGNSNDEVNPILPAWLNSGSPSNGGNPSAAALTALNPINVNDEYNFISVYKNQKNGEKGDVPQKHDTSQYGNTEYVGGGDNAGGTLPHDKTINGIGGDSTGVGMNLTYIIQYSDEDFLGEKAINKYIMPIGTTFGFYQNQFIYNNFDITGIFTPTIFDANGNIVKLEN